VKDSEGVDAMLKNRAVTQLWWGAALVLIGLDPTAAFSQEIRQVAEPHQSVRMAHGGYVCDGKLTVSPIDDTYDMITCSGPVYNTADYAAVYIKRSHDELVEMSATTRAALNHDLKAAIQTHFQSLPGDLRQLAAIQALERSVMDSIDEKLPEGRGNLRVPRPGTSTSGAPIGRAPGQE
jgi:hypothetical protein